ncbi:ShlB/FhaC/HecB family protein [Ramlibacter alkalitolerans]|uniref:ShlB/FhaC/HecB family hemolysin secretion/activation protein n=1 Tax=Ramlibacter alkalitolerans TaxID=2039631 RepID=A0ABS1JU30_9BURK|nr:hypothetical protein [Ramlibacter alkalitolerans]MBL0427795.1 hypothetical protein [Ramlibacter alkalitolerans]
MKKLLLPALLAAIFMPAHASSSLEEYRSSFSLEEIADAPDLVGGKCTDWKVLGNSVLTQKQLPGAFERSAESAGRALTRAYVAAGYITVRVMPDARDCTLQVVELKASPVGEYADFVPRKALRTADVEHFGTLISRHAADAQKRVRITFGEPNVEAGTVEVKTEAAPINDPQKLASTVVYNSLGPRYSGSDVLTAYVKNSIDGLRVEGSASVGLPFVRSESKGGIYAAASGKVSGSTPYGIVGVESNISSYKVGGAYRELNIKGTTWRTQLAYEYPLTTRTSLEGRLGYVYQDQKMDSFGLNESLGYFSGYAGVRDTGEFYGKSTYAVAGGVLQGLGGSQEFTMVPLSGLYDRAFTLVRADGSIFVPLSEKDDSNLQFVTGIQLGKRGVPSPETFYIGGLDRGSSYPTGVYAGHSGFSAGVKYSFKTFNTEVSGQPLALQPFVAFNAGMVKQATGDSATVGSLEGGTTVKLTKNISGAASVATRIDGNKAFPGPGTRLNLSLNLVF